MEKILVQTRGGTGDQIICNGIINHWSENKFIYLASRYGSFDTVKSLYKDNANVEAYLIDNFQLGASGQREIEMISSKLGVPVQNIATHHAELRIYQEWKYQCVGLPFEYRYSKFRLPNVIENKQAIFEKFYPNEPYALIHSIGYEGEMPIDWDKVIPNLKKIFVKPRITTNLLDWLELAYHAEEIHCIPSSFFHLVDSVLDKVKAKLYYHDTRRKTCFEPNNEFNQRRWNFIAYEWPKLGE
jgi:hypothetical protein